MSTPSTWLVVVAKHAVNAVELTVVYERQTQNLFWTQSVVLMSHNALFIARLFSYGVIVIISAHTTSPVNYIEIREDNNFMWSMKTVHSLDTQTACDHHLTTSSGPRAIETRGGLEIPLLHQFRTPFLITGPFCMRPPRILIQRWHWKTAVCMTSTCRSRGHCITFTSSSPFSSQISRKTFCLHRVQMLPATSCGAPLESSWQFSHA